MTCPANNHYNYSLLFKSLSIIILLFLFFFLTSLTSNASDIQMNSIEDHDFFFKVELPLKWKINLSTNSNSLWRLSAISEDKKSILKIYALKIRGNVDLDKFANHDHKMFNFLGDTISKRKIKRFFVMTKAIEIKYSKTKNGFNLTGRFLTDGTYGYAIFALNKEGDAAIINRIFENFETKVPASANYKNKYLGMIKIFKETVSNLNDYYLVHSNISFVLLPISFFSIFLPFLFISKPNSTRFLLIVLNLILASVLILYLQLFSLTVLIELIFFYSVGYYFLMTFLFQNNVYLFYSNTLGLVYGWDDFAIPVILWSFDDKFNFINVFGFPIWRPISYISMLRKYFIETNANELYHASLKEFKKGDELCIRNCKFHGLLRKNEKEKYGSCYLYFSDQEGKNNFVAYADRLLVKIKPKGKKHDKYDISYIKRIGLAPKLNQLLHYDLFSTFHSYTIDGKNISLVSFRAIRKHDRYYPNLFFYWLSTMFFLVLAVVIYLGL